MDDPAPAVLALLESLAQARAIVWVRTSSFAYPLLEVVHLIGLGLLVGTLWIVDLAILGRLRMFDARLLARHLLRWTLVGFGLAMLSGAVLFAAAPIDLLRNPAFLWKMLLLATAGANAALLHWRGPLDLQSRMTRAQALCSVAVWIGVVACGRWIGYV